MANPEPSGNGETRGLEDAPGQPTDAPQGIPGESACQAISVTPSGETSEGNATGDTNPAGRFPV